MVTDLSNAIIVDVNVWLDYLFGSRPGNLDAKNFFIQAKRADMPLVIPPHSLSNLFFLTQRELKSANQQSGAAPADEAAATARSIAWSVVDFVLTIATVGPSDHMDALLASKNRYAHSDYEDNLIVACAQRCKARLLVTNDEKLIKHSPVPTLNARDAAAYLSR